MHAIRTWLLLLQGPSDSLELQLQAEGIPHTPATSPAAETAAGPKRSNTSTITHVYICHTLPTLLQQLCLLLRALHALAAPRHALIIFIAVVCVAGAAVLPGQLVPVLHLCLKVQHCCQAALLAVLIHGCCAVGGVCAWQHLAEGGHLLWQQAVRELNL